MVLIMLKALLILEILVRVVFDQYCLKHGIEISHRFYDLKLNVVVAAVAGLLQ